jgi:hypothetical protein
LQGSHDSYELTVRFLRNLNGLHGSLASKLWLCVGVLMYRLISIFQRYCCGALGDRTINEK